MAFGWFIDAARALVGQPSRAAAHNEEGVARLRSAREQLGAAQLKVQAVLEQAGDLRLTDLDG